jgi:hypothetical protein
MAKRGLNGASDNQVHCFGSALYSGCVSKAVLLCPLASVVTSVGRKRLAYFHFEMRGAEEGSGWGYSTPFALG